MPTPTSPRVPDYDKAILQAAETKPSTCLLSKIRLLFLALSFFHMVLLHPQSLLTSKKTESAQQALTPRCRERRQ